LAGSPYPTEALQYEGVLEDPSSVVRNILERHSLPLRGADIENVHQSLSNHDGEGKRTFEDFRQYYLRQEWRAELDPKHVETINEHIDPEVMKDHGYHPLPSSDVGGAVNK
jgi:hypothetical protein